MRRITCSAIMAAVVGIAVAIPAAAVPPTVGGTGATSMTFAFTATGPQQHFLAETTSNPVDPGVKDTCVAPRCHSFSFLVAGSKKSFSVSAQITWSSPTARFWLNIMDVTKTPESVGSCYTFFTSAGPSATAEARLRLGHKYAVWVSVEQVVGASEAVTGVLNSPPKDKPRVSPLSGADRTGLFLNPCQG